MTDLPETEYIEEALRRANRPDAVSIVMADPDNYEATIAHARTLKELGWKPPVDPALLAAREWLTTSPHYRGIEECIRGGGYDACTSICAFLAGAAWQKEQDTSCGLCGGKQRIPVTTVSNAPDAGWASCPKCAGGFDHD